MSDFLAVAGVTSVLRWMLIDALAGSGLDTTLGATPHVTALPPDRIVVGDAEAPRLNRKPAADPRPRAKCAASFARRPGRHQ